MSNETWRVPDNERPPEQFWLDYGKFVMATLRYDNSDEYWETFLRWADILQRRYQGHEVTGEVILDYLDVQMAKMEEAPDVTERKGRKVC